MLVYLLSGVNGFDVYYQDGKLFVEARANGKQYIVSSGLDYLVENAFNNIIVSWSPTRGLVLARDDMMYTVGPNSQDFYGRQLDNRVGNLLETDLDIHPSLSFLIFTSYCMAWLQWPMILIYITWHQTEWNSWRTTSLFLFCFHLDWNDDTGKIQSLNWPWLLLLCYLCARLVPLKQLTCDWCLF